MTTTTTPTLGIDLGDKESHACLLGPDGSVLLREVVKTNAQALGRFFDRFAVAENKPTVVIEACTHSRWVNELAQQKGLRVVVASPVHVRLVFASTCKTDRFDAEALARLCRVDEKLLHPVTHRSRQAHSDLEVVKARDIVVDCRKSLINHIRFVVKAAGGRVPALDAAGFAKRVGELIPDELRPALSHLVKLIEAMTAQIREMDRTIERIIAVSYPEAARLAEVPGIGPLTSLTFVLTIQDPERFENARDVGAYLGLVPRRDQSGRRDPQLRITKAGSSLLRRLFVNCAHYVAGPFGPDSALKRAADRIGPVGSPRRKKAIVATARKLAVLLLTLWKSGERYDPLRGIPPGTAAPVAAKAARAVS